MAEGRTTMDALPEDVLLTIFSYCSLDTLVTTIQYVCQRWQRISRRSWLWRHIVYKPNQQVSKTDIVKILKQSPKLQAVNLSSHNLVSDEVFKVLADHCPKLRILHLSEFTYVDMALFKYLVMKCPTIEELTVPLVIYSDLNLLNVVTEFLHLKTMIVKATFVGSYEGLNVIACNFPNLEHLELQGISIKKNDLECLIKNKKHQLRTLRLACTLSDGSCVLPHLSFCTQLKSLSLDSLCESIEPLPSFKEVSFCAIHGGNFYSAAYCNELFRLFPRITELQISFCKVYGDTVIDVISSNCPSIQKMVFHGGFFKDETLKRLHIVKKLKSLSISWWDLTNDSIKFLSSLPELTSLWVFHCGMLTAACLDVLASCKKLRIVKFSHCNFLLRMSLEAMREKLPHLKVYLEA